MIASHVETQAMSYRRAAEAVLRYLLAPTADVGRRPGALRLTAQAKALICLAGAAAQARLVEGGDATAHDAARSIARGERAFCRIADAQGWDDRHRDRLELLVETLLDEPAVRDALGALLALRTRREGATARPETRQLLGQHLQGLSLDGDRFRAILVQEPPVRRRRRRLGPGERPLPATAR